MNTTINISHHMNITHYVVAVIATLAILGNAGLLGLIAKFSRPEFGRYKYLMMLFATFNLIFSLFHLILMPGCHVYGNAFSFFVASPLGAYISASLGQWVILYWTLLYNQQLILIVFHFLYRYIVVCRFHLIPFFKRWPVRALLALYVVADLSTWGGFFEAQSWNLRANRWYLKKEFQKFYGIDSETAPIIGLLFKTNGTDGIWRYSSFDIFCMSMLMNVIAYKFLIMCWFTVKIHTVLKYGVMSHRAKAMQFDLFRALIAQTVFPFVLEGVPCVQTYVTAFFGIYTGPWCSLGFVFVSSYPLMDAISMTYFIRDYRRAVLRKVLRWKVQITSSTTSE